MPIQINEELLMRLLTVWENERINWNGYKRQLEYYVNIKTNVPIVAKYYSGLSDQEKALLQNSHSVDNVLWKAKTDEKINLALFTKLNNELRPENIDKLSFRKEQLQKLGVDNEYLKGMDSFNLQTKNDPDWFLDHNKEYYFELLNQHENKVENIKSIIDKVVNIFASTNSDKGARAASKKSINYENNILDVLKIITLFDGFDSHITEIDNFKLQKLDVIPKEAFGLYNLSGNNSFVYNSRVDYLFESLFNAYDNKGGSLTYVRKYYDLLKERYATKFPDYEIAEINKLLGDSVSESEQLSIQLNLQVDQMIYYYTSLIYGFVKEQFKNFGENNKVWFVKPGENAFYWQNCYENHVFLFGWNDWSQALNQILQNNDRTEDSIRRILDHLGIDGKNCNTFDYFLNGIQAGDILVACHGVSKIIGIGTVTSNDIEYTNSYDGTHKMAVHWDFDLSENQIAVSEIGIKQLGRNTILKCDESKARRIMKEIFLRSQDIPKPVLTVSKQGEETPNVLGSKIGVEVISKMKQKNLILYGPPGTGKTYSLIVDYIPKFVGKQKNYEFCTFHQSYDYEEFVEGIKPQLYRNYTPENNENHKAGIEYEIIDGYLKQASLKCLKLANFNGSMNEFCKLTKQKRIEYFNE